MILIRCFWFSQCSVAGLNWIIHLFRLISHRLPCSRTLYGWVVIWCLQVMCHSPIQCYVTDTHTDGFLVGLCNRIYCRISWFFWQMKQRHRWKWLILRLQMTPVLYNCKLNCPLTTPNILHGWIHLEWKRSPIRHLSFYQFEDRFICPNFPITFWFKV